MGQASYFNSIKDDLDTEQKEKFKNRKTFAYATDDSGKEILYRKRKKSLRDLRQKNVIRKTSLY